MKATVASAYTDRVTGVVSMPGETVELSEARAKELSALGYVHVPNDSEKTPARSPAKTRAKRATKG